MLWSHQVTELNKENDKWLSNEICCLEFSINHHSFMTLSWFSDISNHKEIADTQLFPYTVDSRRKVLVQNSAAIQILRFLGKHCILVAY